MFRCLVIEIHWINLCQKTNGTKFQFQKVFINIIQISGFCSRKIHSNKILLTILWAWFVTVWWRADVSVWTWFVINISDIVATVWLKVGWIERIAWAWNRMAVGIDAFFIASTSHNRFISSSSVCSRWASCAQIPWSTIPVNFIESEFFGTLTIWCVSLISKKENIDLIFAQMNRFDLNIFW